MEGGSKQNVCDKCGASFDSPFELIAHERGVRGKACKNKTCTRCGVTFKEYKQLVTHEKNRKKITCSHCSNVFCTTEHFQKHQRTIKPPSSKENLLPDFFERIAPTSGYEDYPGFKDILTMKDAEISDRECEMDNKTLINKKIGTDYTYGDLLYLLQGIYGQQKSAFKLNLGFAFILYDTKHKQFHYYYNSSNSLLFENAVTIKNIVDLFNFVKKIVDLDLQTYYYLHKIEVTLLKDVPIGNPPSELPDYILKSKSIYASIACA